MRITKGATLLLMFLLELGVIVGAAVWGFTLEGSVVLRIVAGVVAPLLFIMMWALFGAARDAAFRLRGPWRIALEVIWFGGGALTWAVAVSAVAGVVFFALWAVDALARYALAGSLMLEIGSGDRSRAELS
ncbi:YrdB family protein [Nocardia sp. NPDC005366]|uniref:YrdB family protein n=1 Tax=Nocardia sp. NPDC005366 TaxID=3156878 RepID=UPI0033B2093B